MVPRCCFHSTPALASVALTGLLAALSAATVATALDVADSRPLPAALASSGRVLAAAEAASAGRRPLVASSWARTDDVRRTLQEVLDVALNADHRKVHKALDIRFDKLVSQLTPLFAVLPKDRKGKLGQAAVRYALHRHFSHHHGMYIKGLEPVGEAWNSASPAQILKERIPAVVSALFEDYLSDGFGVPELALLAATLEHLIFVDMVKVLEVVYRMANHSTKERVTPHELEQLLLVFFSIQVQGHADIPEVLAGKMTLNAFVEINGSNRMFWGAFQQLARRVQIKILQEHQVSNVKDLRNVTFRTVAQIIKEILDSFASLQDIECRNITQMLLTKEYQSSGRVRLADFYHLPPDDMAEDYATFDEPKEYLLKVGAAEERRLFPGGSKEVLVIVPNYMLSRANCMASQGIYTVCCLDPCEELLRTIEVEVQAPTADPDLLVAVVADLPSPTVQAPRGLDSELLWRLNEVAQHHGGKVPLHGRLFAQWLHHAFPRECPYPAKSGTTKPLTANDWVDGADADEGAQAAGAAPESRTAEAQEFENQAKTKDLADNGDDETEDIIPWDTDEELVVSYHSPSLARELRAIFFALSFVAAMFAVTGLVARSAAVSLQMLLEQGCCAGAMHKP